MTTPLSEIVAEIVREADALDALNKEHPLLRESTVALAARTLRKFATRLQSLALSGAGEVEARWFASGPEAEFYTTDWRTADNILTIAGFDRDEWTITDLHNPTGTHPVAPGAGDCGRCGATSAKDAESRCKPSGDDCPGTKLFAQAAAPVESYVDEPQFAVPGACECGRITDCPGKWEKGCGLGASGAHVAAAPAGCVDEAMVERLARAYCEHKGWNPDEPVFYSGTGRKAKNPDGSIAAQWQMHTEDAKFYASQIAPARLPGGGEAVGTFACPLCGGTTPHHHDAESIKRLSDEAGAIKLFEQNERTLLAFFAKTDVWPPDGANFMFEKLLGKNEYKADLVQALFNFYRAMLAAAPTPPASATLSEEELAAMDVAEKWVLDEAYYEQPSEKEVAVLCAALRRLAGDR